MAKEIHEAGIDVSSEKRTYSSYLPDFDIVMFTGDIRTGVYLDWQTSIRGLSCRKKDKVYILIGTSGGCPHDAFKMMQLLKLQYKYIGVVLFGECYSAGTLFALGADEIFMSIGSNLGPLDIQLRKEDEFYRMSGECFRQAITDISLIAEEIFIDLFGKLKSRRDILISTQTASHAAVDIAKGLLSPITQQIEPTKLGEMMRSQNVGISYGVRLMSRAYENRKAYRIVNMLARNYPSHDTAIDFDEARYLGINVKLIDSETWESGIFKEVEPTMLFKKYTSDPKITILNEIEVKADLA